MKQTLLSFFLVLGALTIWGQQSVAFLPSVYPVDTSLSYWSIKKQNYNSYTESYFYAIDSCTNANGFTKVVYNEKGNIKTKIFSPSDLPYKDEFIPRLDTSYYTYHKNELLEEIGTIQTYLMPDGLSEEEQDQFMAKTWLGKLKDTFVETVCEFSESGQMRTKTTGTEHVEYIYNSAGVLTHEIYTEENYTDTVEYNMHGKPIRERGSTYYGPFMAEYTYDEQGRLISFRNGWTELKYVYDKSKLLYVQTLENENEAERIDLIYDKNERVSRIDHSYGEEGLQRRVEYEYTKKGLLTAEKWFEKEPWQDEEKCYGWMKYEYNKKGLKLKEIQMDVETEKPQMITQYTYNSIALD